MSAEAVATVLTGVLGGATGAAGGSALAALVDLVRRAGYGETVRVPGPGTATAEVDAVAAEIAACAQRDPGFARALAEWAASDQAVQTNSISGQVSGPVVQGRDFHGDVNIG